MLKYYVVKDILNDIAPLETQESWDNSGVQIYSGKEDIRSILVALELTPEVVDEAIEKNVDMVITHHPLIFGGLTSVNHNNVIGNIVIRLVKNDISVYSTHTPFDKAECGNNADLAKRLGLENVQPLTDSEGNLLIGGMGELAEEETIEGFRVHVADALKIDEKSVRIAGKPGMKVQKVGFCTGAGAEFALDAAEAGCDVFVTGDVKYHEAQNAVAAGIALVDAGHFGTENIFAENMAKLLKEEIGDSCEVLISEVDVNPFMYC